MKAEMKNQEAYLSAKKRVEAKFGFKIHLLVYVLVIALLIIINLNGSTDYFWVKWPLIGWGIAVVIHWISVHIFNGKPLIRDEMIKKEMEKRASQKT